MTRSWAMTSVLRGLKWKAISTVPRVFPGMSLPGFAPPRHPGAIALRGAAHRKCLIHRRNHLGCGQFIEALAETVEAALATLELARQTGQRVLHQPHIAALLNRAGGRPRPVEAAHRPRPPEARIGRPVERHRWRAG